MIQQRWLRIIPVALIMYTISYVDRTNVSLALDPKISSMMHDLLMDDRMKGQAAGIFFSVTCCYKFPVAIWRAGGVRKNWSACAWCFGVCSRRAAAWQSRSTNLK
jgi:hypothetical protein